MRSVMRLRPEGVTQKVYRYALDCAYENGMALLHAKLTCAANPTK